MKKEYVFIFFGAVALGIGAVLLADFVLADDPAPLAGKTLSYKAGSKSGESSGRDRVSRQRIKDRMKVNPLDTAKKKESLLEDFSAVMQEQNLSAELKKLIEDLREALEAEDKKAIIALVRKMQQREEWPDGIPVSIRRAAIESLGWFGGDCIPELAGFLQDPDPELTEAAIEAYEQALFDANGDKEMAEILIAAAQLVNDVDAMDNMLTSLIQMRPSRQVETIKQIWQVGTAGAKEALATNIELVTGEEGLDTPEKLDAWYNDPSGDNKDSDDAEEYYGPQEL